MRVRKLIIEPKTQQTDTGWRRDDMQPRYAPVFARTLPIRSGWQWRSARAESAARQYVLLARCRPSRDSWQAMLLVCGQAGAAVVGRLEHHGSHPGVHAHSDCGRSGLEFGPSGIDNLPRRPSAGAAHRRILAWTEDGFWEAARKFFRIRERKGPLL